ncbi:MAG TPA: helix-turn-helix domain-containing protein [Usitatibacter sp.]|nr:helix-turn-helix domain-containing protein [Usitatibacter sp.]
MGAAAFVVNRVFPDSDEAAASISGVEVEFSLLAPKQCDWSLLEARLGDMLITSGRTGARLAANGATDRSMGSFLLPRGPDAQWTVNGLPVTRDTVMYLAPGADHIAMLGQPLGWDLLQAPVGTFGPTLEANTGVTAFIPGAAGLERLRAAVRGTVLLARTQPHLLEMDNVRNRLRAMVLHALRESLPGAAENAAPRHAHLAARLNELLAAGEEIYIEDLCASLAVSERSLRRHFLELVDTSPARYLRLRRLHLARRALRDAGGGALNVTRVSAAYGFFDQGRFAADYQRLFGELPSQTLKGPAKVN